MTILGRAGCKAPFCLRESVTPKGRDGLTEACTDGKPMQIFGSTKTHRKMTGLGKFSEKPMEIKLVFVWDDIRFRRFSTTNEIHSSEFDSFTIWGKVIERCVVPEFKSASWWLPFMKQVNISRLTHRNRCNYTCDVAGWIINQWSINRLFVNK